MRVEELYGPACSNGAASKEEMEAARKAAHDIAFSRHYLIVYWIKRYLKGGGKVRSKRATKAWNSIAQDDQRALWIAPSKGGCFTTREREKIRALCHTAE